MSLTLNLPPIRQCELTIASLRKKVYRYQGEYHTIKNKLLSTGLLDNNNKDKYQAMLERLLIVIKQIYELKYAHRVACNCVEFSSKYFGEDQTDTVSRWGIIKVEGLVRLINVLAQIVKRTKHTTEQAALSLDIIGPLLSESRAAELEIDRGLQEYNLTTTVIIYIYDPDWE